LDINKQVYQQENVKHCKRRFTKMSIEIKAPMTGKIASIVVNLGDKVNAEDEVVIMDAMKMEIPVYAPEEGTVKEIKVKEGDSVKTDQVLMILG
jgi:acetyl-CoA carboxylase biotin carboxyl carrier protein